MKKTLFCNALIALALSAPAVQAGSEDDGSGDNVYYGDGAGDSLTSGFNNAFFGFQTGQFNTTGSKNTFLGYQAGSFNTTGSFNTFSGGLAGFSNTTGRNNTFSGGRTGYSNTTGSYNSFSGYDAGLSNTTGSYNSFSGYQAGFNNTEGGSNTFSGYRAGAFNDVGANNTFTGAFSGNINSGNNNVFLGYTAGFNSTGSNNVFLGYTAGYDETGSNKLYINNDYGTRTTPLIYGEFDTRLVGINGILGIGTQTPTSTLHVLTSDGSAQILVEETDATVAPRTLFELKNNGNTKFSINNTHADVAWAFANSGSDLRFSRQGSGVVELALSNAGNLTIQGNLTELSSRTQKHNIVAMNPAQILTKVLALSIKEWSYKDSLEGIRHIGPMAEDFHAAFGLGESPKGIATLDTSGVALAAIQGLDKKLKQKDEEIMELKAEQEQKLTSMQAELDELKALVKLLVNK